MIVNEEELPVLTQLNALVASFKEKKAVLDCGLRTARVGYIRLSKSPPLSFRLAPRS